MLRCIASRTLTLVALTALPIAAHAQTCLGNPSFTTNHLQLSGEAQFAERATSFGASIGSGSNTVFATVGAGGITYEDVDGSTIFFGGTLGYQVAASAGGKAQVCPVLSAGYGMGPNDIGGSNSDLTVKSFSFGLSLGGEMGGGAALTLVPAASVSFVYSSASVDVFGGTFSGDDTHGRIGLTLGMVFNSQLAVRPSVSLPFGTDNTDPIYGIGFALNYGGRR